jgi:hypothetical protein
LFEVEEGGQNGGDALYGEVVLVFQIFPGGQRVDKRKAKKHLPPQRAAEPARRGSGRKRTA